jgi:hypothetical protein
MCELVDDFSDVVTPSEQKWTVDGTELTRSQLGNYSLNHHDINIRPGGIITLESVAYSGGGYGGRGGGGGFGGGYGGGYGPQDEKYDDADFDSVLTDSVSTAARAIEAVFRKFKNNKSYYQAIDCIRFFLPNTTDSYAISKRFRNMKTLVHSESFARKNIAAHILNDPEFGTFAGQITGCQHKN